jgi:DNA-binding NarL/FixJ family response regulator
VNGEASRRVLAHQGLRDFLAERSEPRRVSIELLSPDRLVLEGGDDVALIVPAVAEVHLQFLLRLRDRLPLAPILAVVNDPTDYQAHRARMSGATSVLNLTWPVAEQDAVLRALCAGAQPVSAGVTRLRLVAERARRPRSALSEAALAVADDPEADLESLVTLLCGSSTISAIAARRYCSERSMYRRVRWLYDTLGVSSRSELRAKMAGTPWTRPGEHPGAADPTRG